MFEGQNHTPVNVQIRIILFHTLIKENVTSWQTRQLTVAISYLTEMRQSWGNGEFGIK